MAQNKDKIVTELKAIALRIGALLEALGDTDDAVISSEIADKVRELIAKHLCLQCKKNKSEAYRRGLCAACYRRSQLRVAMSKTTFSELLLRGLILPPAL